MKNFDVITSDYICCAILNMGRNIDSDMGPTFKDLVSAQFRLCDPEAMHYEEAEKLVNLLRAGRYDVLPYFD